VIKEKSINNEGNEAETKLENGWSVGGCQIINGSVSRSSVKGIKTTLDYDF
jgi:hypothetical protein